MSNVEIYQPEAYRAEAEEFAALRTQLYYQQLIALGLPEVATDYKAYENTSQAVDYFMHNLRSCEDDPDNFRTLGVRADGLLVGYFLGRINPQGQEYAGGKSVDIIQLSEPFQGQGIGRMLMERFCDIDERPTSLKVLKHNKPALGFYTNALDFVEVGPSDPKIVAGHQLEVLLLRRAGKRHHEV